MEQVIYRVVTVEGNDVTHVERCFCSTQEKAIEMIAKDLKRYELCGAVVEDCHLHKLQNVAIKEGCSREGWVTATLVKTVTDSKGHQKHLGYVSYAMV